MAMTGLQFGGAPGVAAGYQLAAVPPTRAAIRSSASPESR